MKQAELVLLVFALLFVALVGGLIVRANLSAEAPRAAQKRDKGAKHAKRNKESWDLD